MGFLRLRIGTRDVKEPKGLAANALFCACAQKCAYQRVSVPSIRCTFFYACEGACGAKAVNARCGVKTGGLLRLYRRTGQKHKTVSVRSFSALAGKRVTYSGFFNFYYRVCFVH